MNISLPTASPAMTIADARAQMLERMEAGKSCQCLVCAQTVKVYPRKLNTAMVKALRWISRLGPSAPYSFPDSILASREYSKLAYWGLAHENDKGEWYATGLGLRFLAGDEGVPERMKIYDGRVVGRSQKCVSISDIVDPFEMSDLMDAGNVAA